MDLATAVANAITVLVPMLLSLTVHEYAHARAARSLGDDTAESMGRLTLNPGPHIDIVGTIGLPLLILVGNGMSAGGGVPFFGWAKPVPVNPMRFRRDVTVQRGMMWVAFAGPLSNLLLAIATVGVLAIWIHGFGAALPPMALKLLTLTFNINVALFVFNMLPIYPLDGQKVVSGFLGGPQAVNFERFSQQYGTMLLIGIIMFGRSILVWPMTAVSGLILGLFGFAG